VTAIYFVVALEVMGYTDVRPLFGDSAREVAFPSSERRSLGRVTGDPFLRPGLIRRTLVSSRQEAADHETKEKIPCLDDFPV